MKWVRAVIRPFCLDDAIAALDAMGIHRLTMTEVQQWCEQTAHAHADENEVFPEHELKFVPHVQIDMAIPDELCRQAVDAVIRSAGRGRIGDGTITIRTLQSAMRIRTGETGEIAL
jgi:nitrogen regulatory protein P-II 2